MNKPEPIVIDNERFEVVIEEMIPDMPYVGWLGGCMSPAEAETLRDFLTAFIEWEKEYTK